MIRQRKPFQATEINLPITQDEVVCLTCAAEWTLVRELTVDYRHAACPNCGERNAELTQEAPCVVRRLQ